jgi:transcriptional regulator with XRE-family HTH domain
MSTRRTPRSLAARPAKTAAATRAASAPSSPKPLPASQERDAAATWIGQEIRALRKVKGLTLQALAGRCGKSVGFLSQVERGVSRPTVSALHDLADALDVQINWFFPQGESGRPADGGVVVRKGLRRRLSFASGIADYLLSPNLQGPLELLWSVMEVGADSGESPYTHRGDEAGVVIRGALKLWVGEQVFELEEGDSFSFPSTTPHRYVNPSDLPTEIVWVVTPPSY